MDVINGVPSFEVPIKEVWEGCKKGGAIKLLSPLEFHSDRQRRWYRGPCLTGLSDWSGDTVDEWDLILKVQCGGDSLLKQETVMLGIGKTCKRLTIVGVGKKNMTQYIENILSKAIEMDWPVTPPDPDLRKEIA